MLKTLIKRDGTKEEFSSTKTNRWGTWGSRDIVGRLDWSSVVHESRDSAPEEMTTQEWQMHIISKLVARGAKDDGWPYMVMAGRFYTVWLQKKLHGDDYPSLKDHIKKIESLGLSRNMGYRDDEIAFLNDHVLNHEKNLEMAYHQVEQYYQKYSLRDRVTKKSYETPQFTMIRMAMAVYENHAPVVRLNKVRELYLALNEDLANPPTPNYSSLGTNHYGMASCCLIAAADDALSIQAAGDVGYAMTLASAGLGIHLTTRDPGDPVDGGRVSHAGKLKYIRKFIGDCSANKQGMRGGALNVYTNVYSSEVETMVKLQNPRTPIQVREREVNVTIQTNPFFMRKAALHEKYFTFNDYTAPDLYAAFFKADQTEFEQLYKKYELDDNFKKEYRSAYDTLLMIGEQEIEVSTLFWNCPATMNRHTPFKDPLIQSNLCAAPETLVLTDLGTIRIGDYENKLVKVWNGEVFSQVQIMKTARNAELLTVRLTNGLEARFTPMHKFYVDENGTEVEVRAKDLKFGMLLVDWRLPNQKAVESKPKGEGIYATREEAIHRVMILQSQGIKSVIREFGSELHVISGGVIARPRVESVTNKNERSDTFCFSEPFKHRGVFNGMFTGQCMEVVVPTTPFLDPKDLYGDGDPAKGEVGMCNIGSVPQHNFPFDPSNPLLGYEQYKRGVRAMLEMIDYAIDNSEYRYPAIARQAKARRNASVGMSGVATLFAKLNIKFNTPEGRAAIHRLSERHAFACAEVALEMGIERGNAEWMHRTKWPDGWLVIDTYHKEIDKHLDATLFFDWETLRTRIVANKGIRFSCIVAHMPGEQATRKGVGSNSIYPLFKLSTDLGDGSASIPWSALNNDIWADRYQLVWELSHWDISVYYGAISKFCDQSGSFDEYQDRSKELNPKAKDVIQRMLDRNRLGIPSKYYTRSLTPQAGDQQEVVIGKTAQGADALYIPVNSIPDEEDDGLGDGAGPSCTLDGVCGT